MKTRARLATLLAAGSLLLVGAVAQASANSAITDAFVAQVRPNVDFLDRSSRMALDKSHNAGVRLFAHREALEQTIAANSLVAWTQANTLAGTSVPLGTPVVAPLPVVVAPVPVVATPIDPNAATAEVVTGRSVAEDRPLTVTRAPRETGVAGTGDTLAELSQLEGREFDTLYRTTQRGSLQQLSALYTDYVRMGDDAGLRALAIRELPKINRRLAELRRL